jgi:hypothetical protein
MSATQSKFLTAPPTGQFSIGVNRPGCLNLTESTQAPPRGQRADESIPGSGLGLSIARDLVGLYGGELVFQASSPEGLRITLTLPGGLR